MLTKIALRKGFCSTNMNSAFGRLKDAIRAPVKYLKR